MYISCVFCHKKIKIPKDIIYMDVICPHCKQEFEYRNLDYKVEYKNA